MTTEPGAHPVYGTTDAVTAPDELLERLRHATLGEYDVFGELGRGGMASVYLAHDLALDRKVAIKVMAPALMYGAGMAERFKREARTAASLSHPNIIPIFAVREVEGLLFFVMKLVQGTPLDSIIKELGPLPIPMIEALLGQVGGALGYAHRRGVVHRDIKPANILIDDEGWAVVTDFGIAKVVETEGLTQTGTAVGTPLYMSPEQCLGGEISGASDQYGLGCLAFEMLTGRPPFKAATQMALMYCHCHDAPPALAELRRDGPDSLRTVVERMIEKKASDRWPSLEEAVAAIGAKPLAHDDPTRNQLVALARTGTTFRLVGSVQTPRSPIPIARTPSGQVRTTASSPVPATPPRRTGLIAAGVLAAIVVGVGLGARLFGGSPSPAATTTTGAEVAPPAESEAGTGAEASRAGPSAVVAAPLPPVVVPRSDRGPDPVRSTLVQPPTLPATEPPPPAVAPPTVGNVQPTVAVTRQVDPPAERRTPELSAAPVVAEETRVQGTVQSYIAALNSADLGAALQVFPAMPSAEREGFGALWKSGSKLEARWRLEGLTVTGVEAIGRLVGTTVVVAPDGSRSQDAFERRIRLERRGSGWVIAALVR